VHDLSASGAPASITVRQKIRTMTTCRHFIDQDTPERMYQQSGPSMRDAIVGVSVCGR